MKTLVKPILLTCLLSLFVLPDAVMAQRQRPTQEDYYEAAAAVFGGKHTKWQGLQNQYAFASDFVNAAEQYLRNPNGNASVTRFDRIQQRYSGETFVPGPGNNQRLPNRPKPDPMPQPQTQRTQNEERPRFIDLEIQAEGIASVKFSPDGQTIVTLVTNYNSSSENTNPRIQIWDAESGRLLQTLSQNFEGGRIAAISSDGKKLFIGRNETTVTRDPTTGWVRSRIYRYSDQIWDTVLESKIQTLTECTSQKLSFPFTASAAFSPDGKKIVTVNRGGGVSEDSDTIDKTAQIWNIESGAQLHMLMHPGETTSASFSPDGKKVVTTSYSDAWGNFDRWEIGHVWDAETGKKIKTLTAGYKGQEGAIFSPDERKFTFFKSHPEGGVFGQTNSIVVSEFGANKQPIMLTEQRSKGKDDSCQIDYVEFSPDGKKILTCSRTFKGKEGQSSATVRIWFLEESNNDSTRGASVEPTNSSVVLGQTPEPQLVKPTTSNTMQASTEPSTGTGVQQRQTITVQSTSPYGAVLDSAIGQGLRLGIGVSPHSGEGLRVTHVLPNSAGQRAGFEAGDVILAINGTPIRSFQDYSNAVDDSPTTMSVTVINGNDGQELTVNV